VSPVRRPALRVAQHRALGRKASDEFTVPLCRGHHRKAHRGGDEGALWEKQKAFICCNKLAFVVDGHGRVHTIISGVVDLD
jgi:hypothetical protein